ncbi:MULTISPECIES: sulfurtransferase TusA family protein [unclassified Paenibacillus]|uniref:sulfurtransferase TusA family protein n=1 Tax=unclassified Paenibacillus TaxID=185978 RepID=UPI0009555AA5|nr:MULTISPECIES: sulfurtransferase TusA family protein [unclassified Paenibacillus]ASS67941.1 sulfurtransferase TusA family protein [Paenibacillus sp. RUD330]SIR43374.1 TusA-related sulfurtransferase [Paenibacillus sp. RU4X]SIR53341.1 TusA-related sulfurtransferase [Paenibacillus sp. RU4T]
MNADKQLDAKGLACPMPIVKTKKVMKTMESGQILEIHTTDQGALNDLSAWARSSGNELLQSMTEGTVLKFWIRKG